MVYQFFCTEQGPSASQMAAARILDAISRLPGMAGEANDARSFSLHTGADEGSSQDSSKFPGMPTSVDQMFSHSHGFLSQDCIWIESWKESC